MVHNHLLRNQLGWREFSGSPFRLCLCLWQEFVRMVPILVFQSFSVMFTHTHPPHFLKVFKTLPSVIFFLFHFISRLVWLCKIQLLSFSFWKACRVFIFLQPSSERFSSFLGVVTFTVTWQSVISALHNLCMIISPEALSCYPKTSRFFWENRIRAPAIPLKGFTLQRAESSPAWWKTGCLSPSSEHTTLHRCRKHNSCVFELG